MDDQDDEDEEKEKKHKRRGSLKESDSWYIEWQEALTGLTAHILGVKSALNRGSDDVADETITLSEYFMDYYKKAHGFPNVMVDDDPCSHPDSPYQQGLQPDHPDPDPDPDIVSNGNYTKYTSKQMT